MTEPAAETARRLDRHLRGVGYRVRLVDVATGLLGLLTLLVAAVVAGVAADHLLPGGLSRTARLGFRLTAGLSATAVLLAGAGALLRRKLSLLWLARQVERDAHLRNNLTDAVELQANPATPAARSVLRRACRDLAECDWDVGVPTGRLRRTGLALAAALAAALLLWAFTPRTFGTSLLRLLGFDDLAPPSRVEFLATTPPAGSAVPAGKTLTFTATLRHPGETVELEIRRGDSTVVLDGDALAMDPLGQAPDAPGAEGFLAAWPADLTEDRLAYRVRTGRASSPWTPLRVLPTPALREITAVVTPPAYTGRAPDRQTGGPVTGLPGAVVNLHASANLPVRRALLEVRDGNSYVMAVGEDGTRLQTRFRLKAPGSYRIRYWPAELDEPARSPAYDLRVPANRTPNIVLREPAEPTRRSPQQTLRLRAEADDDTGLAEVALEILTPDGSRSETLRTYPAPGPLRRNLQLDLPVKTLGRAGQTVRLRLLARDHRPDDDPADPSASEELEVTIAEEPPPPSEPPAVLPGTEPQAEPLAESSEPSEPGRDSPPPAEGAESAGGNETGTDGSPAEQTGSASAEASGERGSQAAGQDGQETEDDAESTGQTDGQGQGSQAGRGDSERSGQAQSGQPSPANAAAGPGQDTAGQSGQNAGSARDPGQGGQASGSAGPSGEASSEASGQGTQPGRGNGGQAGTDGAETWTSGGGPGGAPAEQAPAGGDVRRADPAVLRQQAEVRRLRAAGRAMRAARQLLEVRDDRADWLAELGLDTAALGQFVRRQQSRLDASLRDAEGRLQRATSGQVGRFGEGDVRRGGPGRTGDVTARPGGRRERIEDLRAEPVRKVSPRYQKQLDAYYRSVSEDSGE